VALGSNIEDREAHLAHARARLAGLPRTRWLKSSRVEETAPLGPVSQGPYLNQMVLLETELGPAELLAHLHAIERERGRVRALAVTGAQRAHSLPEVPTLVEAGVPGYEVTAWTGVIAPAGLPRAILERLNAECEPVHPVHFRLNTMSELAHYCDLPVFCLVSFLLRLDSDQGHFSR